jgi:hypothetical protein
VTRDQYDSRRRLGARDPHAIERLLGVRAGTPFYHYGLKAPYVDLSRDTIAITSGTFGAYYPAGEVRDRARSMTRSVIADLDKVIAELTTHRDRLAAELPTIAERPWITELAGKKVGLT